MEKAIVTNVISHRVVLAPKEFARKNICLFVSYSHSGVVKPHVRYHLNKLKEVGFSCILILVVDHFVNKSYKHASESLDGCVVRLNAGYDFGAWADGFRIFPQIWQADRILIINDSIAGPVSNFQNFMTDLLSRKSDVVGLSESLDHGRHFQSYFLLFNKMALRSKNFQQMWAAVDNLPTKTDVINAFETKFVLQCLRLGLTVEAVYPTEKINQKGNPTIFHWEALLDLGFPYVKIELLRDFLSSTGREEIFRNCSDKSLAKIIAEI